MVDIKPGLERLGLELPEVVPPVAVYQPAVRSGNYIYVSGQLPVKNGEIVAKGKVGSDINVEQAYDLAGICALNGLAAIGSLINFSELKSIVKVVGFVASAPNFNEQPKVINGASEFLGEVLGEAGKHARSAVGVSELPLNVPVEIEFIAELNASATTYLA